jgi:hypothetical protein
VAKLGRESVAGLAREDRRSLSQYIELALEAHAEAVRGKEPKTKS